jgi:hypothetical protein
MKEDFEIMDSVCVGIIMFDHKITCTMRGIRK